MSHPKSGQRLSESERRILEAGGLFGPDSAAEAEEISNRLANQLALEYHTPIVSALSEQQVATMLGVPEKQVRQRDLARGLYGINTGLGRVYPSWQFYDGKPLPGLEELLRAIPSDDMHPVEVERFIRDETEDLLIADAAVSPRSWLAGGHDPRSVCRLAEDL